MDQSIRRRDLIATGCVVAASAGLAGCSSSEDTTTDTEPTDATDDTTDPGVDTTTNPDENSVISPQAAFDFEYTLDATLDEEGNPWNSVDNDGTLTITHVEGDTISSNRLYVRGTSITTAGAGLWSEQVTSYYDDEADGEVTAGDSISIEVNSSSKVRVVWESPDGDSSSTLAEYSGPGQ